MMNRKLDIKEMILSSKNLMRLQEEFAYNEYQLEICTLKLNVGLEIEHRKQIRDYKVLKKEYEEKVKMTNDSIKILKGQMRNGVKIKEVEKEDVTDDKEI